MPAQFFRAVSNCWSDPSRRPPTPSGGPFWRECSRARSPAGRSSTWVRRSETVATATRTGSRTASPQI